MFPWAPVVDKKIRKPDWHVDQPPEEWNFLREDPEVLINNREFRLAQYMTGVTRDEAAYILCEFGNTFSSYLSDKGLMNV